MIIRFLSFSLLIWFITLIDLHILKHPFIPGINSTWSWCMILLMCCWILFFFLSICLFIYLWLCWVFASARGPSLVVASGGHSSSRCAGLSPSQPLLLRSTGSRRAGSAVVAHGLSCSAARGIFPDQGSNPCPLHWQADSQPLRHQGSPCCWILFATILLRIFASMFISDIGL